MPSSKPEIRIQFSFLLQDFVSANLDKFFSPDKSNLSSYDDAEKYTEKYKNAWSKYEDIIIQGLINKLGLNFYKPVIDVSLADYMLPMSQPIIINFRNEPDVFIDVLTHELIHVLLTDNQYFQIATSEFDLISKWKKLFGDYDFNTLVHIPVQAIMKYVYLDILKDPIRLDRDIENSNNLEGNDAYKDSWSYVMNNDYNEIIEKIKSIYTSIN